MVLVTTYLIHVEIFLHVICFPSLSYLIFRHRISVWRGIKVEYLFSLDGRARQMKPELLYQYGKR